MTLALRRYTVSYSTSIRQSVAKINAQWHCHDQAQTIILPADGALPLDDLKVLFCSILANCWGQCFGDPSPDGLLEAVWERLATRFEGLTLDTVFENEPPFAASLYHDITTALIEHSRLGGKFNLMSIRRFCDNLSYHLFHFPIPVSIHALISSYVIIMTEDWVLPTNLADLLHEALEVEPVASTNPKKVH